MPAIDPRFALIQQRLRGINPDWYPPAKVIDQEFGDGMARGLDLALSELETTHNVARPVPIPPPPAPAGAANLPAGVPSKFSFLRAQPLPPLMVRVALELFGTREVGGGADNPVILGWADEVARGAPGTYNNWAADFYNDDSVPWCGLFMAVVAVRAAGGRPERLPPPQYLAALSWGHFGVEVPIDHAAVGDVMVLGRAGGGHVTLNVGTEVGERRFFGLGGNQSDNVTIAPFDIGRVRYVRRPLYNAMPPGARRVILSAGGISSVDEA